MKHTEYIQSLSNENLTQCVKELETLHSTTILPEGKVREIMDIIDYEIDSHAYSLQIAENSILNEVAKRFVKMVEI